MSAKDEFHTFFKALQGQVSGLCAKWEALHKVFLAKPSLVDLLAQSPASNFFTIVYVSLRDDVLVTLCRILDPPKSCGHDNASIKRLAQYLRSVGEDGLEEAVICDVKTLAKRSDAVREQRNMYLAHSDLQAALGRCALPVVDQRMIEEALEMIVRIMNTVEETYWGSPTDYRTAAARVGVGVVNLLSAAEAYRQLVIDGKV
jgi:hypothetical protein